MVPGQVCCHVEVPGPPGRGNPRAGAGSQHRQSGGPLLARTQGKTPLSRVASVALSKRTVSAFYLSKNDTLAVSGYGVVQDSHLRKLFHCCFAVFSDQGEERS